MIECVDTDRGMRCCLNGECALVMSGELKSRDINPKERDELEGILSKSHPENHIENWVVKVKRRLSNEQRIENRVAKSMRDTEDTMVLSKDIVDDLAKLKKMREKREKLMDPNAPTTDPYDLHEAFDGVEQEGQLIKSIRARMRKQGKDLKFEEQSRFAMSLGMER